MVLSVTARLDELKANIIDNTSIFSDSKSRGVDEMFEWMHAVASATSQGPVLLVLTFADKVQSQVRRACRIDDCAIVKTILPHYQGLGRLASDLRPHCARA